MEVGWPQEHAVNPSKGALRPAHHPFEEGEKEIK